MTDIAELGFAVNTAALKEGSAELDKLSKSAKATEDQAKRTSDALSKSGDGAKKLGTGTKEASAALDGMTKSSGAAEAAAKRLGITVEEYNARTRATKTAIAEATAATQAATPAMTTAATATRSLATAKQAATTAARAAAPAITATATAAQAVAPAMATAATAARAMAVSNNAALVSSANLAAGLNTLRPAVIAAGGAMGTLPAVAASAKFGIAGVTAALAGGLVVSLAKSADAADNARARFGSMFNSAEEGRRTVDQLRTVAERGGVGFDDLSKAVERATRGLGTFKPEPGVIRIGDDALKAKEKVIAAFSEIDRVLRATHTPGEGIKKAFDEVSQSIEKTRTLSAAAFAKIREDAPTLARALTTAFMGAGSSLDAMQQRLERQPATVDEITGRLRGFDAAANKAFDPTRVQTLDESFRQIGRSWDRLVQSLADTGVFSVVNSAIKSTADALDILSGKWNIWAKTKEIFNSEIKSLGEKPKLIPGKEDWLTRAADATAAPENLFTRPPDSPLNRENPSMPMRGTTGEMRRAIRDSSTVVDQLGDNFGEVANKADDSARVISENFDHAEQKVEDVTVKVKKLEDTLYIISRTDLAPIGLRFIDGADPESIKRGIDQVVTLLKEMPAAVSPSTDATKAFGEASGQAATSLQSYANAVPPATEATTTFATTFVEGGTAVTEKSGETAGAIEGLATRTDGAMQSAAASAAAGADAIVASMDRIIQAANQAIAAQQAAASGGGAAQTGVGSAPYARGGAFVGGYEVTPFARGGVITKPTLFPMADGMGLMGEAGPEAVMPLARTSDGKLGVSVADTTRALVPVDPFVDIELALEDQTAELRNALDSHSDAIGGDINRSASDIIAAIEAGNILLQNVTASAAPTGTASNTFGNSIDDFDKSVNSFGSAVQVASGGGQFTSSQQWAPAGAAPNPVMMSTRVINASPSSGGGGGGSSIAAALGFYDAWGGGRARGGGDAIFAGPFATGGSFTVPGAGGTDSVRTIMDVTPGERVTVSTPGQVGADAGLSVEGGINISLHGITRPKEWLDNESVIKARIAQAVTEAMEAR